MTISEIAKEAGVSVATVSRFMNNGPVKEETRKKLEQIVLKLNNVTQ
ncbi:MAG: LacI family DNA-binding transcriptional regulator [Treponema sp.]|nr:LacI family DNA-binding transcriptional regulator [Treponema sp.]